MQQGLLIVISGPSGAGKGTICRALRRFNHNVELSISATTRAPRRGEREGVNYFFKTVDEFKRMIEDGEFLEYAEVYGNYYGTPKSYVRERLMEGKDVILEIDIQGALSIKEKFDDAVFIFILPPSMEELKRRIVKRGTESEEELLKRFNSSYKELNFINRYNYVVINDVVEAAARKIDAIITAEKCRVERNKDLYINYLEGLEK
ncbi:guanylate kinase [Mahella australiensis]|jgi:guanylate kinase|uniref:Guanylate kinase n=1 Tax=Mahella australiensis (strain DSM 15567 / CIP 107919 / 50-1 BON) TaxID=697281 RepID=F4A2D0_MAHA5|nr:guanylate kinase [Mahella australiensis]AEE96177.1 guanylate kinase [Mahella australiensis 50-1 BON]